MAERQASDDGQASGCPEIPDVDSKLRVFSQIAAVIVFVIAALILVGGWLLGVEAMRTLTLRSAVVVPNTALGLAGAGAALWLLQEGVSRGRRLAGWLCAALPVLIGLLTLAEYGTGRSFGTDALLVSRLSAAVIDPLSLRPWFISSLALLLLGLSLLLLDRQSRRGWRMADVFALGAGFLATGASLGHLIGGPTASRDDAYVTMSLLTVLAVLLLAAALLVARPRHGLIADARRHDTLKGGRQRLWAVGFVGAMTLLVYSACLAWLHAARTQESASRVSQIYMAEAGLTELLSSIQDIETGARGYVISGDASYLEPFEAAVKNVADQQHRVLAMMGDEHARASVSALEALITERIAIARHIINLRQNFGFDVAQQAVTEGSGKKVMDRIRATVANLRDSDHVLLNQRIKGAEREAAIVPVLIVISTGASAGLLMFVFLLVLGENRLRQRAEEALRTSAGRLDLALQSGHMSAWDLDLIHDTAWRSLEHDQIFGYESLLPEWGYELFLQHVAPGDREHVAHCFEEAFRTDRLELECQITRSDQVRRWILARGEVQRDEQAQPVRMLGTVTDISEQKRVEAELSRQTQALQVANELLHAANAELGSFSYSVSHDLRAPLRHVQGYVELLTREIAASQLSDKARHYLQTITNASVEMGHLIDDLLAYSRMGQVELHESRVRLDELAQDTIQGLEMATRGRNINWKIGPLPPVFGDPTAIKQVLVNFIGNAIKYSRSRDPAQIEIGYGGVEDGRVILFVRDNGVGFEMEYAHKLFGVFQRLHRASEFEGTGIGLAIVRRVVARHGGRVWAEGVVNQGATFYFTLQPAPTD
jgi:signal transduction histidine kinase